MQTRSENENTSTDISFLLQKLCHLADKLCDNAECLCRCASQDLCEREITSLQEIQELLLSQISSTQRELQGLLAKPLAQAFPVEYEKYLASLKHFEELNRLFIQHVSRQRGLIDF